jgi:hypothetical protein
MKSIAEFTGVSTSDGNYIDLFLQEVGNTHDTQPLYKARFRHGRLHPDEEGIGLNPAEAITDLYRCHRDLSIATIKHEDLQRPLSPYERQLLCQLITDVISRTKHIISPPEEIGTLKEINRLLATQDS